LGAGSANARVTGDEDPGVNRLTGKPNVTQAVQGDQVKPSAPTGFSKEYLQSVVDGTHPRPLITKEKAQALLTQLKEQGVAEGTDDIKKQMSKLEALALAANRAGDDAKCKRYQEKIQSLKQKLSQSMSEGLRSGEYHIHTVYFKDGTKKRIRVTSDEFDVADYYTKRGQAVDRVDYDFQLHSDMTEAEKEPTTRQELLDRVDKIQRMMTQERNPANLQILRKKLEMLKQRYQHLKEDSDSGEAVEMAIMRRMLVAHTDLIVEFGLDKVVQAIEEVAYNVGDTDEIGSSDVSGWVRQVERILGVDA